MKDSPKLNPFLMERNVVKPSGAGLKSLNDVV